MSLTLLYRRRIQEENIAPNTYIGGVSATINTPALLAAKLRKYPSNNLAFSEANITDFNIIGSDIQCSINADYYIADVAFKDITALTHYRDYHSRAKSGQGSFWNNPNLTDLKLEGYLKLTQRDVHSCPLIKRLYFPNVTEIGKTLGGFAIDIFKGSTGLQTIYLPNCTLIGSTVGDELAFRDINATKKIYIHPSMQTINGGAPEGDLASHTVSYIQNYTKPSAITNLSYNSGGTTLNFTPPSSTNALDFYEVYVNGFYKQKITGSGATVSGLISGDKVTVYACDIYYNRSISNEITI